MALAEAGPPLATVCENVMFWPAFTGFGLPALVTLTSACPAVATPMVTVAELSFRLVSCVAEAAVAVSVMIVPAAVPAVTVYTTVMVAVEPGGTLGLVQATGATLGQVQVPPPAVTADTDTKLVFAGVASPNVAVLQLLGPWLNTVCV